MRPTVSFVSRRRILAGAGAAATCLSVSSGAKMLRAEEAARSMPDTREIAPDGFRLLHAGAASVRSGQDDSAQADFAGETAVWGFQGAVPGPLLRVKRGAEVRLRLINELPDDAAVDCALHWHGVRAPNLMDGVPGLTQAKVVAGGHFDYRFRPPDAGTFWYHVPWVEDAAAARQHLHGVLLVEEAEPPEVDREHVLLFDDWPMASRGDPPSQVGPFRITTNGKLAPDLAVRANERVRLRLINAAKARVVALRLDRHAATVMAIDGQPSEPFRPRDSRIVLGPGNTADLFVDATLEAGAAAPILLADASGETPLARLAYDPAPPLRPAPLAPPRPLPANPLPARLDLTHAVRLDLSLDGLARGTSAHREPARFKVKRGRTVMLGLANSQEFACAVHVHGHAFRLLDRLDDGWKPFWLASVLVDARQTARIAFAADNPGKWLIECVAIGHPEIVRSAWFEVA